MVMKVDLKFELGDKVNIIPCETYGIIYNIRISRNGTEYNVKYYEGTNVKYEPFYEDELELKEDKKEIGF